MSQPQAVDGAVDQVFVTFAEQPVGGRRLELDAGTTLYEQASAAEHVYFVQSGQVRLYQVGPDGEGRLLEILGPGEWFGYAALSEARVHGVKAVAVESSVVTQVGAAELIAAASRSPQAATQLIRQLAAVLQAARDDAARLVFDDCNSRLVKTLLRFSHSAAASPHADGIALHITHEQLAQAVGVARETVSLALTEMRLKNLVRTGRNQLTFNPAALEQFVSSCTPARRATQRRGEHAVRETAEAAA